MARVKAQKVIGQRASAEDILGKFCYYYRQYTYAEARRLPMRRVLLLLDRSEKERARDLYDLANILMACHFAKNSSAVKNLIKYYQDKAKE